MSFFSTIGHVYLWILLVIPPDAHLCDFQVGLSLMVPSFGLCGRKEFNGGSEGFFYRKILVGKCFSYLKFPFNQQLNRYTTIYT
jgi:hypothetical protein